MTAPRRKWVLAVNLAGVIAAIGCSIALWFSYRGTAVAFRCTVAIPDPYSGRIDVTAEIDAPRARKLILDPLAPPDLMRLANLRALTPSGSPLATQWRGGNLEISTGFRRRIVLRYQVWPGAPGRHGHQGWVAERFGLVQSRLLFFAAHAPAAISSYTVRFELPPGWRTVSAWEPLDGGWLDPRLGGRLLRESLEASTLAFGEWDTREQTIGGNRLELDLRPEWQKADRDRIALRAARIFEVLQAHFGFRLRNRFVVVFVPKAPDGNGIAGSYWSNGLGNDMDDSPRAWSLYAHRIVHVINRDYPYGTHLLPQREYLATDNPVNWFNEGMASFLEVWAPLRAGVVADDRAFRTPWEIYEREHLPLSPRYVAAAREPQMHDADFTEYLHYAKAPILMQNLDYVLRTRSHGQRDLAGYAAQVYVKYGEHRAAVPFFDELSWYAGFDLGPFFQRYVVDDDILMPLWGEALAVHGPREVVAQVDGQDVLADRAYLRQKVPEEVERLVEEKLLERELRVRAAGEIPDELLGALPFLPESTHALMVRKMRELLCRALFGKKGEASERALDARLAEWRKHAQIRGAGSQLPIAVAAWRDTASGAPVENRTRNALTPAEGECALRIARAAMRFYVERARVLDATALPDGVGCRPMGALLNQGAAFVTLRRGRELRGCIGSLEPQPGRPLWRDIVENAGKAALHDGRYPRVTAQELDSLRIEVSVLSPLREIKKPSEIRLGTDGLVLAKQGRRGLFLPWVAIESGWDVETTLVQLARKAGLPDDAWRRDAHLSTFDAQEFAEPR